MGKLTSTAKFPNKPLVVKSVHRIMFARQGPTVTVILDRQLNVRLELNGDIR